MAKKKRATRRDAESPTISCLLICDDVFISAGRQKHYLEGVVGGIVVQDFPTIIGPFVAYIRFSNVYGGQEIVLSISHAAADDEVFRVTATSPQASDPLKTHTLILRIPPFAIQQKGRYIFSASHHGVPFAQSLIEVQSPEELEEQKASP